MVYGKPRETFDGHVAVEDLSALSLTELEQRAADLVTQIREAKELEDALPPVIDIKPVVDTRSVASIVLDLASSADHVEEKTVSPSCNRENQQHSEQSDDSVQP